MSGLGTAALHRLIANRHSRACSNLSTASHASNASSCANNNNDHHRASSCASNNNDHHRASSGCANNNQALSPHSPMMHGPCLAEDSDAEPTSMHSGSHFESPSPNIEMTHAPSQCSSPPSPTAAARSQSHELEVGDYVVLGSLQQGCWGEVRVGLHKPSNRRVCLKFVASGCTDGSACAAVNLSNEVSNLARCDHRGVSHVEDVLNVRVPQFTGTVLVMPMHDHGDLLEYIQDGRVMDEKLARFVFRQLVDIVESCHEHKVAHLDIKPEHVLFDAEYSVKLVDFGHSCCFKSESFRAFSHRGTVPFMAPEVVACETSMTDIETSNGFEVLPHCTVARRTAPRVAVSLDVKMDCSPSLGTASPSTGAAPFAAHRLTSYASSPLLIQTQADSAVGSSSSNTSLPSASVSPSVSRVSNAAAASTTVPCAAVSSSAAAAAPAASSPSSSSSSASPCAPVAPARVPLRPAVSRHNRKSWKLELPPSPRRKKLEHLFEESYDARAADVWSCGILLATILFGAHPFDHAHHSDVRYAVYTRNSKSFWQQFGREHGVKISKDCESLLNGMLEPNPRKRFTLQQVASSSWFTSKTMNLEQFRCQMRKRHAASHRHSA